MVTFTQNILRLYDLEKCEIDSLWPSDVHGCLGDGISCFFNIILYLFLYIVYHCKIDMDRHRIDICMLASLCCV